MTIFTKSIGLLISFLGLLPWLESQPLNAQMLSYPSSDIRSVAQDVIVPPMVHGIAAAGTRVRETHPDYRQTQVYHATYLPKQWHAGEKYPVIIEFAGNGPYRSSFGDLSSGRVEGSCLGIGISRGEKFIWVCLPYLNNTGVKNVTQWWGNPASYDPQPTVEYCKKTVAWICETYGGDPERVLLVGFSRGAIACNYLGLYDDEIAGLWKAMIPYSHYDGVRLWGHPKSDMASARTRLKRLRDTPQLICHEDSGRGGLEATTKYLDRTAIPGNFTFLSTGFRNHNDAWVLRPSSARAQLRRWVQRHVLED